MFPEIYIKNLFQIIKEGKNNELRNNFNNNRFDDLYHLCIYRHPLRIYRNDKIMTGKNSSSNSNCNNKDNDDDEKHNTRDMHDLITTYL